MDRALWMGALLLRTSCLALAMMTLPLDAAAFELWGTGPLANSTVQSTEDFEIRYHDVPEELPGFEGTYVLDYIEQVNRLNLLLANPNGFSLGAQIDQVALFSNRYYLDDVEVLERDILDPTIVSPWRSAHVMVEKMYYKRKWKPVELTLGDSYASFGRGIALNIVKNTDIDIDTSIRGAKAILRGGDLEATLVAGVTNRQQISQDNPNELIYRDPQHMVSGARVEHYGLGGLQAGAHGVVYSFARNNDTDGLQLVEEPVDVLVGGVTAAGTIGGVDLFGETDLFQYRNENFTGSAGGDTLLGHGTYASASFYPGKSVFLIEAKHSEDTERLNTFTVGDSWEVANIPTLEYERVITEDSTNAVNSNDITGARVRMDYAVKPAVLTPYVALAGFRDRETSETSAHFNSSPETIGHGLAGVQYFQGDWVVQINGGYRVDVRDDPDEGADRQAHMDGELHFPVFGHDALELLWSVQQYNWGNNPGNQQDFLQMENALSYYRGEDWVFVLFQDFTDNPLVTSVGNISEDVYLAGEVIWQPGPATTLRFFYGAYKAGIRCSGGQCRVLPGFQGGRFSFNGTF